LATVDKTPAPQRKFDRFKALFARHWEAFRFILTEVLPLIIRNGRRPVLFSRYSGMGDIICTVPAARQLMQRHPGATFLYNCHADFAPIPRMTGVADRITSVEAIGVVGYWYRFLFEGFYHFAHGDDVLHDGCKEPMVAEFCRQFGLNVEEEHPELPILPAPEERALAVLRDRNLDSSSLILIHPGPSWTVREWPHENWVRLIERLRQLGFENIGQMGVARHLDFGEVKLPIVPGTTSLINAFSVEECIAAIAQAKLFIGIDSGLLHIAAGTRTPSVGIFGMTLPEFRFSKQFRQHFVTNRVPCAGCEHRRPRLHWKTGCPYDIQCMRTLSVDEVLRACCEELEAASSTSHSR
jgi:ADP-heptose:LPS heptosyltransferase